MKTESGEGYTWDDVIFENRNKNYGAYAVRQSYSRNTMVAFGTSISFVILLLFLPQIISLITGSKVEVPKPDKTIVKIIELISPPRFIEPEVHPPVISKPVTRNLPIQVVTEPVETVVPTNSEVMTTTVSSTEGTVTFTEPSVSVVPEVPVVVNTAPRDFAEVMPKYRGGSEAMMKFISKGIKYPRSASVMGIEGTVYVSFVINFDGQVADVKVVRGISADCDKEAMRVIAKMTEWEAGMQNHQPVSVRMVAPIKFQISRQ